MRLILGILLLAVGFALGVLFLQALQEFDTAPPEAANSAPAREPEPPTASAASPQPTQPPDQPSAAADQLTAETGTMPNKEQTRYEPVRGDIRNVTPDRVLPGPQIETATIERLPAIVPPPPPPEPPKPESWTRTRVLAGGVVRSGDTTIAIAGIEPLAVDAQCRAADGAQWPCGNHARAALQRLIRGRAIKCDPVDAAEEPEGATIRRRCHIAGRDIGEWLVARGWARPLPGSGYDEALAGARDGGRGQWRGDGPQRTQPRPALLQPGVAEPVIPDVDPDEAAEPLADQEF